MSQLNQFQPIDNSERRSLHNAIKALVNMLGGEVVITQTELNMADELELEMIQAFDIKSMMTLRLREKK